MTLSAVIVNWNTGDLLEKCVRSVFADAERSGIQGAEVIVVDNASKDDSARRMRERIPAARVVFNNDNRGFARATNQGIRLATGRLILLLNPDTEVAPGALTALSGFLADNPQAGAAGARLLNSDGSLQESAYPEPTLLREFWRLFHLDAVRPIGVYPMSKWATDHARAVDVLMGACILIRREVLDGCGLLDERYFIYSEDQDLCRRFRKAGWGVFWVPQATVLHHGGQSTRQVKVEMFLRLYSEKIAYFRKHHGNGSAATYKIVLFLASVARQVSSLPFLLGHDPKRQVARDVARNYRRLVRELPGL